MLGISPTVPIWYVGRPRESELINSERKGAEDENYPGDHVRIVDILFILHIL